MTTDLQSQLRNMVGENAPDTEWDDDRLQIYLDRTSNDLELAAALIWEDKASSYAQLVNVSESGSSRSLGDMYKNALAMADRFRGQATTNDAPPVSPVATRTRTRAIVRP